VQPKTLTASIIGDPTKTYDCNTDATLTSDNFSLSGLVGTEDFTVTKTTGAYNSKDVATADTVTTTLAAGDFTPEGATQASDYNLPTSASGAGHITKAHATIDVPPYNVTYDYNAHTATGTATGCDGDLSSLLDLSGTTHTLPGDYTSDPWTFNSDNTNTNYFSESGTVHDIIHYGDCLSPYGPGGMIFQPINADGTSVFKQGSTVPVKFTVCDASGAPISNASAVFGPANTTLVMLSKVRGTISPVNETMDTIDVPTTAWRFSSGQWIFNLATKNLQSGYTYKYRINLLYGYIDFQFGVK
jgi:hypothetical protein